MRGLDAQTAWLSLDRGDDDPLQFLRYLAAALEPLAPGIIDAVQPLLDEPEAKPERVLAVLLGMIQGNPQAADENPLLLVLDDLQQIDSALASAAHDPAAGKAPRASAFDAPGTKDNLRAAGPALCGGAGTGTERSGTALSARRNDEPTWRSAGFRSSTPETLACLDARSEGWILALQLMATAAGDKHDINAAPGRRQSGHGWLAEYLTSQILVDLSPAKRTFLLRTAILEHFNRSLLAFVTGVKAPGRAAVGADRGRPAAGAAGQPAGVVSLPSPFSRTFAGPPAPGPEQRGHRGTASPRGGVAG